MKRTTYSFIFVLVGALIVMGSVVSAQTIKSAGVNGMWGDPTTWLGGVVPSANSDVVIANGDTVTINVNVTVKSLTVGEGTSGILNFPKEAEFTVTVNGDVWVKSGASFKVQTHAARREAFSKLRISGNLRNDGSGFDMRVGSAGSTLGACEVEFFGSTNSTVTMGPYSSSNNEFNAITINKSGSGKVILGSDIFSAGGSTGNPGNPHWYFTRGLVQTGAFAMVHNWGNSGAIATWSDSSYVLGGMGHGMSNSGGTSRTFHVGDAFGYRPINVRSTTGGSATGHYVKVQPVSGNAATGTSTYDNEIDKVSEVRYYRVSYHQGTTSTTQMTFDRFTASYGLDDGVAAGNENLRVGLSDSTRTAWMNIGPNTTLHTTRLDKDSIPRLIQSDVTFARTLSTNQYLFFALARVKGTTENSLKKPATFVEQLSNVPATFALDQNYPNPFNPTTNITFSIPASGKISLKVFDLLGKEVATLVDRNLESGAYSVSWNAAGYPSGMYLYRLTTDNSAQTRKMVFAK